MQRKGMTMVSKCQCCRQAETIEHVLLHNQEVKKVWSWVSTHILLARFNAWKRSSDYASKGHIRILIAIVIAWFSWKARNEAMFENKSIVAASITLKVLNHIKNGAWGLPMSTIQQTL